MSSSLLARGINSPLCVVHSHPEVVRFARSEWWVGCATTRRWSRGAGETNYACQVHGSRLCSPVVHLPTDHAALDHAALDQLDASRHFLFCSVARSRPCRKLYWFEAHCMQALNLQSEIFTASPFKSFDLQFSSAENTRVVCIQGCGGWTWRMPRIKYLC